MYEVGYRYRFFPTSAQRAYLAQTFGCVRVVYNRSLEARQAHYKEHGRGLSYYETSALLTTWKKQEEYRWLSEVPSVPLQQALRHLQVAYAASKDPAGRYFISFRVRHSPQTLPPINKVVGLDLGITHAVITSDGEKIDNSRYLKKALARLRREQKSLSRKQNGSSNWHRQRLKVARLHARVADLRRDFSHKLTTDLVRRYDVISIESLNVRGMVKNHSLAQSISDVAWGEIRRQLRYKCQWYGRRLVEISSWEPTSKRCSVCGATRESLPLSVRAWVCDDCGSVHDRDVNAALNVRAVGLTVLAQSELKASGLSVSPMPALSG